MGQANRFSESVALCAKLRTGTRSFKTRSCRRAHLGHHELVAEERLGGGRGTAGVVRIGDTVHRPTGLWTPTIHAYLRHIHEAGFTAAPEVLGFDEQNREVLTYIQGQTWGDAISSDEPKTDLVTIRAWPEATRSDRSLAEIGHLYAALHRAARGFRPEQPIWREYEIPTKSDEIVTQGDAGPWNVVYDGWQPVGLIDWDGAQPRRPIDDLAAIAWHFVPLGPDAFLSACGFQPPFGTARRRSLGMATIPPNVARLLRLAGSFRRRRLDAGKVSNSLSAALPRATSIRNPPVGRRSTMALEA